MNERAQHLADLATDRSKWNRHADALSATVDGITINIDPMYGGVAWRVCDGDFVHRGTAGSIPAAMRVACDYAAAWLEQTRNPQHIES